MHCPNCGCHVFTVLLDFSKTDNNIHQDLMSDDTVTCQNCHRELVLGELEPDNPDEYLIRSNYA